MTSLILGFSPIPESALQSQPFLVLMTFVAINTVAYAALSLVKLIPPIRPGSWFTSRSRRGETRSIHPDEKP